MQLALLNANFRHGRTSGGNAHIDQFVRQATALGHDIWMDEAYRHPLARALPLERLLDRLHLMGGVYIRVASGFPEACRQVATQKARRRLSGPVVWEFNVAPDYRLLKGASEDEIERDIRSFRQHASSCDLAICVSRALSQFVQRVLGLNAVITIPNGSDPELFHPGVPPVDCIQTGPEVLNVVWLGSAHIPWHNLALVRRTAWLLWQRNRDVRIAFHIIGGRLDESDPLPPNVSYHGPIAYEDLPRWLSAMDVGLVLYHPGPADFCSPLKMYDYMASGLAVIGSRHPQISEVLMEGDQSGSVLQGDRPEALAEELLALAGDRERVAALGRAARRQVVGRYNWRQAVGSAFEAISRQECQVSLA